MNDGVALKSIGLTPNVDTMRIALRIHRCGV